jgi:hypothetical protein
MLQLSHVDAELKGAENFFSKSFLEDAGESFLEAKKRLVKLDQRDPEVMARKAIAKDMLASIAMAKGQFETAESKLKEAIAILNSVSTKLNIFFLTFDANFDIFFVDRQEKCFVRRCSIVHR